MGEVLKSSAGMNLDRAKGIVEALLKRYEDKLEAGYPEGYQFHQIYDLQSETVRPRFATFYVRMKEELEELGLRFDNKYA